MSYSFLKKLTICTALFAVASCAPTEQPFKGQKIGKPYAINGVLYRPAPDSTYDKIGDASWYGPGFDGKRTASGEVFDEEDVTAAHPTLPMPSLVKVTNLKNNQSVVVRINDRGPYHSNRIIDLSKKSAQMIDLKSTQPVRVQFLDKETEDYINSVQGSSPRIDMFAYNEKYRNLEKERETAMNNQMASVNAQTTINNAEVESFAPIQTVSSEDIMQQKNPLEKPPALAPAKSGGILIKDAEASETNVYPLNPEEASIKETPLPSYTPNQPIERKKLVVPMKDAYASKAQPVKPVASNLDGTAIPSAYKPSVPEKAVAEKTVAEKVTESGNFIILAGSFSAKENAEKLVNSLSGSSEASMDKINVGGKEWWRVHVGPFSDKQSALETLKVVQNLGAPDARVSKQ